MTTHHRTLRRHALLAAALLGLAVAPCAQAQTSTPLDRVGIVRTTPFGPKPRDRGRRVLALSPAARVIVTADTGRRLTLRDARTGQAIRALPALLTRFAAEAEQVAIASDEYLVAHASDSGLVYVTTRNGREFGPLAACPRQPMQPVGAGSTSGASLPWVYAVALTPLVGYPYIATACSDGHVTLWHLGASTTHLYLGARAAGRDGAQIYHLAYSPDGSYLAALARDRVYLMEQRGTTGVVFDSLMLGDRRATDGSRIFFLDGGALLAVATSGSVDVYSTMTRKRRVSMPLGPASSVASSRSGHHLAVALGPAVQVWDAARGALLLHVRPDGETAQRVWFTDGDRSLIIQRSDGTLRRLALGTQEAR